MKTIRTIGIVSALSLIAAGESFAIQIGTTWSEDGNAGFTVATAQTATGAGSLTAISGTYVPDQSDVDFYNIGLVGGFFDATISSNTDPMLFLWDSVGNPLLFNDDWFGLQSYISGVFPAGQYILGVSRFSHGYGLHNADVGFSSSELSGGVAASYTIALTGATSGTAHGPAVPDGGSTALMMGLTVLGLGAVRRKLWKLR